MPDTRPDAPAEIEIRPAARPKPPSPIWHTIVGSYMPAAFLAWAVYGMVRPAFDPTAVFDPVFWAVGGGCLLTLYGRFHTRDLDVDDDDNEDPDETFDEKYRFSLPRLFREDRRRWRS